MNGPLLALTETSVTLDEFTSASVNWGVQLRVHLGLNLVQRIRGTLAVPLMQGVRDVSRDIGQDGAPSLSLINRS
jgi:hypothetical protein